MRDYVRRLLAEHYEVVAVADGEAALEAMNHERPDLVLSDVMMPRLDGFGLIKAIRAHPTWQTLPIILLSARAGEESRVEGFGRGADDYLVKPFSARELLARVTTHVELARVRKETNARVRESEERFRLAVEAADVGTWSWEMGTDRIELSDIAHRIFGLQSSEFTGKLRQFIRLIHPGDRERATNEVLNAVQTGAHYRSEVRVVRPDQQLRWISTQGRVFSDEEGKPLRMLGAVIDITENRVREQKLRDAQARLDATLDAAAIETWTLDIPNNRVVGDSSLLRLFSFPRPEEESAPIDDLLPMIHPDDRGRVGDALSAAMRGEIDVFEEDYRIGQPDGTFRWVASRGKMRHDPDQPGPAMTGVLIDITAQKMAEEERTTLLREEKQAREEAEALGATARALTEDLDLQSTVQKATDAATRLTGAQFGAFFYNGVNERQESYVLYTLSGASREAFEEFGLPRNTQIFAPTFKGEGVVRLDDVMADPRYGKNLPHHGLPKGHLPVRSYLAVPVKSRNGEVIGGLFFGHAQVGVFTARAERIALGIAAQASIAMDNAKLYQRVQSSVDRLNFSLSSLELGDWNWDAATDLITFSARTAEIYNV
jgi:PAS domain S-box-containing protein